MFQRFLRNRYGVLLSGRTKSAKKTRNKKRSLPSSFTIATGIIAILFLIYRILLLLAPAGMVTEVVRTEQNRNSSLVKVCGIDGDSATSSPIPVLSASYQQHISSQPHQGSNLVQNAALTTINPTNGQPVGYTHNFDNKSLTYERLQDPASKTYFLRIATKAAASNGGGYGWIMDPVSVDKQQTYAFTFQYRSSVPVMVNTEYANGSSVKYHNVTRLNPTDTWQTITAHTINLDNAKALRFTLTIDQPGQLDERGLAIYRIPDGRLSRGMVSITFDDGWKSMYDKARPILNKYHIKTTQFIVSKISEAKVPGYMSLKEVKNLQKEGNEIGSHTLTHCDQTTLSTWQLEQNATESRRILNTAGLGTIDSFAYPYGRYNESTQNIFSRQYHYIRTSDFGYNDRYFDPTNIRSIDTYHSLDDKEFQANLDYARTHRLWLTIVYHRIDESGDYSVSSAAFDKQMQMIKRSGLDVMPLVQAAQSIR